MTTRKEQKEQRKLEIMSAALELFVKKGYSATRISDIAEAAGMSAGLMFHYFESKEALLEELVKVGLEGTQSAMQFDASDPLGFFTEAIDGILDYIKMNSAISNMFVLMERAQKDAAIPEHIREIACQVDNVERSVAIIEEGQRLGQIREGDPYALSATMWSCVQGVAVSMALGGEDEPDFMPEAEWIVDIIRKK